MAEQPNNALFSVNTLERAAFDWEELDGKTLNIKVVKNETTLLVAGFEDDKFYVLHAEPICERR